MYKMYTEYKNKKTGDTIGLIYDVIIPAVYRSKVTIDENSYTVESIEDYILSSNEKRTGSIYRIIYLR